MLVAGLFNAWRSVGIHAHTQHSLEDVQDRDVVCRVLSAHIVYRLSTAATVCDAASQFKSINFHLHHGTYLGGYTCH